MMDIPITKTWRAGLDKPIAEEWNKYITAVDEFMLCPPHVQLGRSGTWSLSNNLSTAVNWNTAIRDPDGMWDSEQAARATVRTSGLWEISACIGFSNNYSDTGFRRLLTRQNGSIILVTDTRRAGTAVAGIPCAVNFFAQLLAGDFIEVFAYQNSGASMTVGNTIYDNFLTMKWVARN